MKDSNRSSKARFQSTHWSLVVRAGAGPEQDSREALETLFQTYWYPLYAFARRQGYPTQKAEDLTQGFFLSALQKNFVEGADPSKGRFRSFLLVAFKRFIANDHEKANAQIRGGGAAHFSLDVDSGDQRYALEPVDHSTPDRFFDRKWAVTLLQTVMSLLRNDYAKEGKSQLYSKIRSHLSGERAVPYRDLAEQLEMTESSLRVAVHRIRARYRKLLQEEISRTLVDPSEAEEELAYLRKVVAEQN